MKSLYKRLVAVLGATSICVLLMVGCGGQKPAEEVKTGGAVVDSIGGGDQASYTTIQQVGTISYPTDTKANKIDLNQWIVKGTAPNSGTIPNATIVSISSITWIPTQTIRSQQWPGSIPPSGITDQAVQVTANDTTTVPKPK